MPKAQPDSGSKKLRLENNELRSLLREAEETLNAIRNGDVDAIVVSGTEGDRVFSLATAETPYRIVLEEMDEGAVITSREGLILYSNRRFSEMVSVSHETITGKSILTFIVPDERLKFIKLLQKSLKERIRAVISFASDDNTISRLQLSLSAISQDLRGDVCIVAADITDIWEKLGESETKYKELVEHSRSIIIKQDPSGRITFFNEYAQKLFGYKEAEIIGKTASETIVPEFETSGRKLHQMLEEIYTDPDKYAVNLNENIKKNGERIWVEWHNKALRDSEGKSTGHIAVGQDVSSRLKAENSLRQSEENFRILFEKMDEGFALIEVLIDKEGKPYNYVLLKANPAFERHTGLKVANLVGKGIIELLPETEQFWIDRINAVALSGNSTEFENYSSALNRDYRVSAFCPKFGQVAILLEDITERKFAEKELEMSNEKLEIALDTGNIGVWELNLKNKTVTLDKRMEKIFKLKQETFENTIASFEDLIDEEDLTHFRKAIDISLATGGLLETIFRTRANDRNSKYIETKALINKSETGTPISLTGVCIDVTGVRKGAEKAIVKLNEELLRSNKELENFAYFASHDLQEPLRMVTSFTQLLEKRYGTKLDQDAHDYIAFAVDGATRMHDLINGLLAYSRVQRKERVMVKVNMADVVEKVLGNLILKIKEKDALITWETLPVIFADVNQMIQLVQNLMENALKFSKDVPRICISSRTDDEYYEFSVKDEGIGIDPLYFDKIFKIFHRLMPRDEYSGTGIGLAICRRIVERHNGKIWVKSEPGMGATFYFTISRSLT